MIVGVHVHSLMGPSKQKNKYLLLITTLQNIKIDNVFDSLRSNFDINKFSATYNIEMILLVYKPFIITVTQLNVSFINKIYNIYNNKPIMHDKY